MTKKGAPLGNRFWELRSTHGRSRLFATPKLLWEEACKYFTWCQENPLIEIEAKTLSGGMHNQSVVEKVELPKMRAFTMQGLCGFLDCNTVYFNHFETAIKDKTDKVSKDFNKVITRIREVIYQQKFEGAAAGFLNPNIIARDLGLVDKKELEAKIDSNTNIIRLKDGTEIAI